MATTLRTKLEPRDRSRAIGAAALCAWLALIWLAFLAYSVVYRGMVAPEVGAAEVADFLPFVAIAFAAQLVDGAFGMGFGVIISALLLAMGISPVRASSAVHLAEGFSSFSSAISHAVAGNVDWRLFAKLVIPGIIGGVAGAALLFDAELPVMRHVVMAYLAVVGLVLIVRTFVAKSRPREPRFPTLLGLVGGFLDAAGGGGWGPIVAGGLHAQMADPRRVAGTVDVSEFFVTVVISAVFIGLFGIVAFSVMTIGLAIGGVVAAPFGALLARRLGTRASTGVVGVLLLAIVVFDVAFR